MKFASTATLLAVVALLAPAFASGQTPTDKPVAFKVFDNLRADGKPDLAGEGLLHCNIIYAGYIWHGAEKAADYGQMPDESAYKTRRRREISDCSSV